MVYECKYKLNLNISMHVNSLYCLFRQIFFCMLPHTCIKWGKVIHPSTILIIMLKMYFTVNTTLN